VREIVAEGCNKFETIPEGIAGVQKL